MKLVLHTNKLPEGYDKEALALRIDNMMTGGFYIAVYVEEREDADYEIKVALSVPDAAAAYAAGTRPLDLFIDKDVRALVDAFEGTGTELGALSRKFESNGDPGAIGEDRTGGPSYGAYQIASRVGTMASFLRFLESFNADQAKVLNDAGGDPAARAKAPAFVSAWKSLAEIPSFYGAQHGFIKATHYDPFLDHVGRKIGLDIASRHAAVKDAAWSTAVQHGANNNVWRNALGENPSDSDEAILKKTYGERSKVEIYFKRSTAAVQASVKRRFEKELADALKMLA